MPRSSSLRALALLALLVLSALPVAPTAHAQGVFPSTPVMCFDKDPAYNATGPQPTKLTGKQCPGGIPDPPNYDETITPGATGLVHNPVLITLQNLASAATLTVYCNDAPPSSSCHEVKDSVYKASVSPQQPFARFPDDFTGEQFPGAKNALAESAGRYNGSWTVQATFADGTPAVTRTFDVWLVDAFTSTNATLMAGERHQIVLGGFESNAIVQVTLQRYASDGTQVNLPLDPLPATHVDQYGHLAYTWNIPKDETARLSQCPATHPALKDCYQLTVRGTNTRKDVETVPLPFAPALLDVTELAGPQPTNGQPISIERTQNASFELTLTYPSGNAAFGPGLVPTDLPPGPAGQPRQLLADLVLANSTNASAPQSVVGQLPVKFDPLRSRWTVAWTVPRDLPLAPGVTYTIRLAAASDQWGNKIPQTDLGTFSVSAAKLQPEIVKTIAKMQRGTSDNVTLRILYHNGTPFSDQENASVLQGCFQQDTGNTHPVCSPQSLVTGSYQQGLWVFPFHVDRTDSRVDSNLFFQLAGGSNEQDKWGNTVQSVVGDDFPLTIGSPLVDFQTVMRGRAATTLERGERIGLQATIAFPDGTPFNATTRDSNTPARDWAGLLNVTITKRGEGDAIQDAQVVQLRIIDPDHGVWVSVTPLDLSLDVEHTPAGRWSFDITANDSLTPQNINHTIFDRTVVPTPIRFEERSTGPLAPSSGSGSVTMRFQLYYPSVAGQTPQLVPPDAIQSTLVARAYAWDAKTRSTVGDPVSGPLQPAYATDLGIWTVQFAVPGTLFNGSYVLKVTGTDKSGNPLQQDAWGRAFSPQSPLLDRQILAEPQPTLQRGDSATVLVAQHDGDVGPDGTGSPTIAVQRWNGDAQTWDPVAGASDVRQVDSGLNGHFGAFPVTTKTPIGTYRFVFTAREAAPSLALVRNVSTNFTVLPTQVSREIIVPPAVKVTKGDTISFAIERQDGDKVSTVTVLLDGRATALPHPILVVNGDHFNSTWKVPFDAPNGNYTIHVDGTDLYGNVLSIDLPPVEAVSAQLQGRIIGDPPRIVQRGTPATLIFGITYPGGQFYTASDAVPTVVVYNDTDLVATALVDKEGSTYVANWTPPATATLADYWFEVTGHGIGGNTFPALRSASFRLSPGTFTRDVANDMPAGMLRTDAASWTVPIDAADKFVSFEVSYYGPTSDLNRVEQTPPRTTSPIPHTRDDASGRYVVKFVTDQQTPVGAYRIFMKGEDTLGNTILSRSSVTVVKPTTIIVTIDQQPPSTAFAAGKTLSFTFTAKYRQGALMDERLGHPSVALLLGGQPTTQKPDLTFENGKWVATLQIPDVLPNGEYTFALGGQDQYGNQISTARSIPYTVNQPLSGSFAKLVPGPDAAMMLGALAGVAVALAAVKRRRG